MRTFHKRYAFIINILKERIRLKGKRVVDAACGEGDGSIHFFREGCEVYGIDISKKCINIAKQAFPDITFYRRSLLETGLPDDWSDIFICSETLEHLSRKQSMIASKEIKRVCSRKSYICITVPDNKKACMATKLHKQYLSRKTIMRHFRECEVIYDGVFYKNPKRKNRGNRVVLFMTGG